MIHFLKCEPEHLDFVLTCGDMQRNSKPPKKHYKCGMRSVRKLVKMGVSEYTANRFDLMLAFDALPIKN